jgi:signal transduction histidine kinase
MITTIRGALGVQVLTYLISNAIKFSPRDAQVLIILSKTEMPHNHQAAYFSGANRCLVSVSTGL